MTWTRITANRNRPSHRAVTRWVHPGFPAKRKRRKGRARQSVSFSVALAGMIVAGTTLGLALPSTPQGIAMPNIIGRYGLCHSGGGRNCVVDGDTFYHQGEKIRIADIDAPETHPPRCEAEEELGTAATQRLRELLNSGPIDLVASEQQDRDKFGRLLRTVERGGESLGGVLVDEGLARWYGGGRRTWC